MRPWIALLLVAACGSKSPPPEEPAEPAPEPDVTEQIKAERANAVRCEQRYLELAGEEGALCLETAVVGDAMVKACFTELMLTGFEHDLDAETSIGSQTGKQLTCYHREPPPPAP